MKLLHLTLTVLLLAPLATLHAADPAKPTKPNFLVIVADDLGHGDIGVHVGLDDAVGRVTDHLRKTGKDKDTLIFFFSDNGGSGRKPFLAYNTGVNTPLRGDKGQTLEGGIRVPFFVSWPDKIPAGKTYDHPVIALDIPPTACAVAGAKADADVDGVDLLKRLNGADTTAPHEAL